MGATQGGGSPDAVHERLICIGLVADPDLPAEIAHDIADQLPERLSDRVDSSVRWKISERREPLPVRRRPSALLEKVSALLEREGWDLAICLTDLPLQVEGRPVVAEASRDGRAALISLPALGATHERARTREVIVGLVAELLARRGENASASPSWTLAQVDARREEGEAGVRFVTPPARGTVRLMVGMVRANRPWRLILGLLGALTAAVATATLANLNVTVWRVAAALGAGRLTILMVLSLGGMVAWLVAVHKLWRRSSTHITPRQAMLFNLTTLFTLLIGVATLYAGLFAFNLLTGALVVANRPLHSALGHAPGLADHLRLAWFVSSVATVGGALGSGLESNAAVRAAAYRYQAEEDG
jgi:hypothetical protein